MSVREVSHNLLEYMHMGSKRKTSPPDIITKKHIFMLEGMEITDTALALCSYLIFLGKAEAVVGLKSLYVVGQVGDGNGRVLPHSWSERKGKEGKEKE